MGLQVQIHVLVILYEPGFNIIVVRVRFTALTQANIIMQGSRRLLILDIYQDYKIEELSITLV